MQHNTSKVKAHSANKTEKSKGKRSGKSSRFPLTKRKDGRWQKMVGGKRYYFTGAAEEALKQWENLQSSLTQIGVQSCRDDNLCQAVVSVPVEQIRPAAENDILYGSVDQNSDDFRKLVVSIQDQGVLQPLIISEDDVIVSGHKRYAAARVIGLASVPCIVLESMEWAILNRDQRIAILREHNRYRHKSIPEQIREELIDADPEQAVFELQKQRHLSVYHPEVKGVSTLAIEGVKRRCGISNQKSQHVKHVKQVVFEDRKDYWPLSVRAIHYALLNHSFLRNTKQKIPYVNDGRSYGATSELCTRLRLLGEIPWESIDDGTRPFEEYLAFSNARHFVRQEVNGLFSGYWRDYLQSQPNYVEILCEKNAIYHMVLRVAKKFQIPTMSGRGFCSIDPWHDLFQRYRSSGKQRLILIVLSDYDPEGEMIPHVGGRTLRDDFGVEDLAIIKAGVTREQIERYSLPSQNFAKQTSSNHKWFLDRNDGNDTVYELEALEPADMLEDLESVITNTIDMDLYRSEVELEKQEAAYLAAAQKLATEALRGIDA